MKSRLLLFLIVLTITATAISAQNNQPNVINEDLNRRTAQSIEDIVRELGNISKSVTDLNARLKNFSETFNSNQGLKLTERQQKLLAAFEFLNRAEQRLANLQTLKITLSERQTAARMRLAQNEIDSKPENIDRSVAVRGAITDADEMRESRRRALITQRNEINALLNEIKNSIAAINEEIRQTENFLRSIRQRIFPEIEKELSDL